LQISADNFTENGNDKETLLQKKQNIVHSLSLQPHH